MYAALCVQTQHITRKGMSPIRVSSNSANDPHHGPWTLPSHPKVHQSVHCVRNASISSEGPGTMRLCSAKVHPREGFALRVLRVKLLSRKPFTISSWTLGKFVLQIVFVVCLKFDKMVVGSFTRLDCALLPSSRPTPRALPSPIRCIAEPLLGDTRKVRWSVYSGTCAVLTDMQVTAYTYFPRDTSVKVITFIDMFRRCCWPAQARAWLKQINGNQ